MLIEPAVFYEVLERCPDLFPEWEKEGDRYWNSKTGYMVYKGGAVAHDAVYRGYISNSPIFCWQKNKKIL